MWMCKHWRKVFGITTPMSVIWHLHILELSKVLGKLMGFFLTHYAIIYGILHLCVGLESLYLSNWANIKAEYYLIS